MVEIQKPNRTRRAGLVFLAVVLGEPLCPRAALGSGELRAAGTQRCPLCLPKRDHLGWGQLMVPQAHFQAGQEHKLARIGCCSERGKVASVEKDRLGLG